MGSNPLTMGYKGGDLLLTGAAWPTVGSLPKPVCAGCGWWPPLSDESAFEVAWPPAFGIHKNALHKLMALPFSLLGHRSLDQIKWSWVWFPAVLLSGSCSRKVVLYILIRINGHYLHTTLTVLHEQQDFIDVRIQFWDMRVNVRNDIFVTRQAALHNSFIKKLNTVNKFTLPMSQLLYFNQ